MSPRDTNDMLARVSRSETEAQGAYRRIEEQLRGMSRRLEATERTTSDNNRQMTQAASEINVVSREQAQAFEQLGNHVIGMGERIERMERSHANDSMKEAVKGLHQGLSRLADQIADTANQSVDQISQLAGTLEAVVGKMGEAQEHAEQTAAYLGQRISLVDDRVRAIETTAHVRTEAIERAVQRLEEQQGHVHNTLEQAVADIEQRHADIRDEIQLSLSAAEKSQAAKHDAFLGNLATVETRFTAQREETRQSLADLETRLSASQLDQSESQRQADHLDKLNDTIDRLTARVATQDVQNSDALARVASSVEKLESSDSPLDRRVQSIERVLADVVGRLENVERTGTNMAGSLEDSLRTLSTRLEGFDKRNRDTMTELRQNMHGTAARLDVIEGVPGAPAPSFTAQQPAFTAPSSFPPASTSAAAAAAPQAGSSFAGERSFADETHTEAPSAADEAPPFPIGESDPAPHEEALRKAFGSTPSFGGEHDAAHHDFDEAPQALAAESFDASGDDHGESFLAQARRSARSASGTMSMDAPGARPALGGFTWGATAEEPEEDEAPPRTRAMLIGIIALIAIVAVGAGIWLSQHLGHKTPATAITTTHAATTAPKTNAKTVVPAATHAAPAKNSALPQHAAPLTPAVRTAPQKTAAAPTTAKPASQTPVAHPGQLNVIVPNQAATIPAGNLTKLAQGGNANAELALGLKYLNGDGVAVNNAQAGALITRAANAGIPVAEYQLGRIYERGLGVKANPALASHWYEAAAKQGNRKSMYNLALAYAQGTGSARNFNQAAFWFSKAAQFGLADAQFNLAVLYERGLGVPQSLIDAYKWYAIAAGQGDAGSKARLDVLATQISPDAKLAAQRAADLFSPTPVNPAANVAPEVPNG